MENETIKPKSFRLDLENQSQKRTQKKSSKHVLSKYTNEANEKVNTEEEDRMKKRKYKLLNEFEC